MICPEELQGKQVLILGAGVSGLAAARLALSLGAHVTIMDQRASLKPADGVSLLPGWTAGNCVPEADLAVISPGVPVASAMPEAVRRNGTPVIGELAFASALLPETCRLAAITGTNGKTTTTELAALLFRSAGLRAECAGNIGTALSDTVLRLRRGEVLLDILSLEASTFQLESCDALPLSSAAMLNLASDHINRHGSLEAYGKIKLSLFRRVQKIPVLNADLLDFFHGEYPARTAFTFSARKQADFSRKGPEILFRGRTVLSMDDLPALPGEHNMENVMAALALLHQEAGPDALFAPDGLNALKAYHPGAHRIEAFAEWKKIRFIDDSKATNPHSVNASLRTIGGDHRILLILGGSDKAMDFRSIAADSAFIRQAFLCGASEERICEDLHTLLPCRKCGSFQSAVTAACDAARSGDVVLLSPACASFDCFHGYAERGDTFQKLVREWISRQS